MEFEDKIEELRDRVLSTSNPDIRQSFVDLLDILSIYYRPDKEIEGNKPGL